MTAEEFTWWLRGFLAGRPTNEVTEAVLDKLDEIKAKPATWPWTLDHTIATDKITLVPQSKPYCPDSTGYPPLTDPYSISCQSRT